MFLILAQMYVHVHCGQSCVITLCATSYLERGFGHAFQGLFTLQCFPKQKVWGGGANAVADWLWTWDTSFDLSVLPLSPIL